jgi:hypothetical protein
MFVSKFSNRLSLRRKEEKKKLPEFLNLYNIFGFVINNITTFKLEFSLGYSLIMKRLFEILVKIFRLENSPIMLLIPLIEVLFK